MPRTYAPPPPEPLPPPAKTESITVFGVRNGVWRFTFLACFFYLSAGTVLSCRGSYPGLLPLLALHLFWWIIAAYCAHTHNRWACFEADLRALAGHKAATKATEDGYVKLLKEAEEAQPIRSLERNRETDELEPVRAPLLIDPRMGVQDRH